MPVFFPLPYPDELLYGVLSRYHVRSGNTSFSATMKELLGKKTFSSVFDMPCHIDALASVLPSFVSLSVRDIIRDHTLYPYYTAFLPQNEARDAYKTMRKPFGGNIHIKLGITASTIHVFPMLKYCPECCRDDFERYGEFYWHRLHNTPGVLVCSRHKVFLEESPIEIHEMHKQDFIAADADTCPISPNRVPPKIDGVTDKLCEVADDIEWLYDNYEKVREISYADGGLKKTYRRFLKIKFSPVNIDGHRWGEFIRELHDFYGSETLEKLQSNYLCDEAYLWPMYIIKNLTKTLHPLRHLLLMRFFCGIPANFIDDAKRMPPEKLFVKSRRSWEKPDTVDIERCRSEWRNLIETHPGMSRTQLKKFDFPLHTKLFRYDYAWLKTNSPRYSTHNFSGTVDWKKRDRIILEKVKAVVKEMRGKGGKPIRISLTSVGKRIGWLTCLEKHPDKLPISVGYLKGVSESVEDFQVRRVEWSSRELVRQGKPIDRWRIERLAGLTQSYALKVKNAIRKETNRYINDRKIKAG